MREKIALFGEKKSLIGIVSGPESGGEGDAGTAVILLNSGLLHRVGPNRLYVKLSRELAAAGYTALRFDLSGIGDSQRANGLPPEQSAIRDVRHAMDFLTESRGIQSFILLGICSGADDAFRTACEDPRVIGVVRIDGFAFVTADVVFNAYVKRLFNPRSWSRLISGKSDILGFLKRKLMPGSDLIDSNETDPVWPIPETEDVERGLKVLAKRGVDVCSIFFADGAAYYRHKKHYAAMMQQLGDKNQVHVFKDTDHLFSPLHIQKSLIDLVREWTSKVSSNKELALEDVRQ